MFYVPIIDPKSNIDPQRISEALETTLDMLSEDVLIDFQVTTRTWKHPPLFAIERAEYRREVYTTNKIYKFIARGTRIRYAIMSKNFRAKTVVNSIRSRVGRGGMVFLLPKGSKLARPGILARNFEVIIAKKWRRGIQKTFNRALEVALR